VTRSRAPALAAALALALVVTLMAAGCGSTSLSAQQLHNGAARACLKATRGLDAIPTPPLPAGGAEFLKRGITAITLELAALKLLHSSGAPATSYTRAVDATGQELAALKSSLKGLTAGNDPVVAIKTLQQQLQGLEQRAHTAWAAAGVPACAVT
jgi:hypothetical protein